jgi:hypothetical protein
MAKQAGHIRIRGTIGNLTYYQMGGEDYVRKKSSLTRKDVKTKKCFEGSRRSSTRFGAGNIIASEVYQSLPATQKMYRLFPLLRTKAIALVKQGLARADVKIALQQLVNPPETTQLQENTTECPANNNLPSKDIYPERVSFITKARRIQGLAGEKATSSRQLNLPVIPLHKQFSDFVLRSHGTRPDTEHNYVVLSKRAFLTYQRLFLQGP